MPKLSDLLDEDNRPVMVRHSGMEHETFTPPNNPIGNFLQEWARGVKYRTLHPLETLAKAATDVKNMSPTDMAMQFGGPSGGALSGMVGMFAGKGAKTADVVKLAIAEKMKAAGVADDVIHAKTGWFSGMPDGKWRFEIPDDAAKYKGQMPSWQRLGNELPIQESYSHADLYSAYPDVASIKLAGNPANGSAKGSFDEAGNRIFVDAQINPKHQKDISSTTLHELQHAIQQREGFARGGSPETFVAGNQLNPATGQLVTGREGYDMYKRLAGEAEARLTQARMNMTAKQRAASYPPSMFDVPVEQQIVRYGDGAAMSAPDNYRGEHTAPLKDSGAPLHDVTGGGNYYPDDIYSANGLRYYGDGNDIPDRQSFNAIMAAKGKPKAMVTAYRAVPNANSDLDKEIKSLNNALAYRNQYPFFSMKDDTHRPFIAKYADSGMDYNSIEAKAIEDMQSRLEELTKSKKPAPSINHGDWVTLSKQYAKEHGEGALNGDYKIITKKIPARRLFTNGDSINEFGYDSTVPAIATGAIGLSTLSDLMNRDEYQ